MLRSLVGVLLLSAFNVSASFAGDCQAFLNKQEFEDFQLEHGKSLKGVETFEESNIPPDADVGLPNPLRGNVPNVDPQGIGFPTGLEQKNIVIQDNITPGCSPPNPNPGNTGQDLVVLGPGRFGANSKKVGANINQKSLDLIFPDPGHNHTGVGFELGIISAGDPTWHITVYGKSGTEIGQFVLPGGEPEPAKAFFGISCDLGIGRINICAATNHFEIVDDIQMWEELPVAVEPATWGWIKNIYHR